MERLERVDAVEAEKKQQLIAHCREKSETANRQLAEDEESLQKLQSKVATGSAQLRERRELVAETAEDLMVSKAEILLQSGLLESA